MRRVCRECGRGGLILSVVFVIYAIKITFVLYAEQNFFVYIQYIYIYIFIYIIIYIVRPIVRVSAPSAF